MFICRYVECWQLTDNNNFNINGNYSNYNCHLFYIFQWQNICMSPSLMNWLIMCSVEDLHAITDLRHPSSRTAAILQATLHLIHAITGCCLSPPKTSNLWKLDASHYRASTTHGLLVTSSGSGVQAQSQTEGQWDTDTGGEKNVTAAQ